MQRPGFARARARGGNFDQHPAIARNRARPEQLPPSDEEKIALFDTMFAYSGGYTVESDRVVHHVDRFQR
jgi:hypothetical protein